MNGRSAMAALAAGLIFALAPGVRAGIAPGNAIVNDPGFQANSVPRGDDGSSSAVTLPFAVNFFGDQTNQVFVNINGNVTFDQPLPSFSPDPLVNNGIPIIAPYWADWDTRPANLGTVTYGTGTVNGHQAFGVNWINIGYFNQQTDKTNSVQLLLVDRSDTGAGNYDIQFNYNQVQWETGDNSGGFDGLGGNAARVGFSDGATQSFELPGSGVSGTFIDGGTKPLTANSFNSNIPGQYIFQSRGGIISTPGTTPSVPLPAALWMAAGPLAGIATALGLRRRKAG